MTAGSAAFLGIHTVNACSPTDDSRPDHVAKGAKMFPNFIKAVGLSACRPTEHTVSRVFCSSANM